MRHRSRSLQLPAIPRLLVGLFDSGTSLSKRTLSRLPNRALWGLALTLVVVFLGLGLPFSLLYLNYNEVQLSWIWIVYVWEVPALGFLFVILPASLWLRPVRKFLELLEQGDTKSLRAAASLARREALELPLRLPILIIIGSLVGYGLGSLQCRWFADLPYVEIVKNMLFALPIGLLYSLLAYFVLAESLRPVVERCDPLLPEMPMRPYVPLFSKVAACLLVSLVVTIFVMGLMAYTSSQRLLAELGMANQSYRLLETVRGTLMVSAFSLGVVLLLALALARNLLRPLNLLSAVATRPASRLHEALAPCNTDDELEELYQAFGKLIGELSSAQRDLADKVQTRTRETREQQGLLEIARAVGSTLELDHVLQAVVSHVCDFMLGDGCALWLIGSQGYKLKATRGIDIPERLDQHFDMVLTHRRPLVLENRSELFPPWVRESGFTQLIVAPLGARGRLVGLVAVFYRRTSTEPRLDLLMAAASQAAVAIENARLYADREHVARLMRRVLEPPPDLAFPGTDVGAWYQPSMEMSGDYFEVLPVDDHRVAVVVADVAGKGPDAAIHTAQARHILQAYTRAGLSPGETMRLLNLLVTRNEEEPDPRLITVFYGIIDTAEHTFRYACAGHEPALLWTPDKAEPEQLRADGILLGAVLDVPYQERVVPFPPGGCLVLYTDGITEARAADRSFFGLHGLIDLIRETRHESAAHIVDEVVAQVQKFANHHLHDDVSLLVVKML